MLLVSVASLIAERHIAFNTREQRRIEFAWLTPVAIVPSAFSGIPIGPVLTPAFLILLIARVRSFTPQPATLNR
jgi:hypothetical protein